MDGRANIRTRKSGASRQMLVRMDRQTEIWHVRAKWTGKRDMGHEKRVDRWGVGHGKRAGQAKCQGDRHRWMCRHSWVSNCWNRKIT